MTVLQAVSARFTGGRFPGVAFPANTLAGSNLLAFVVFSNNNSSTVTTGLTSENPSNQSWGAGSINSQGGTSGMTIVRYNLANAAARLTHDASSGATFKEVLTLDVGTFATIILVEQDADIEGVDAGISGSGTGTTLTAASGATTQYGDRILALLAHRNTDDQTITAPAAWLPSVQGAGNPLPTGAAANSNAVSVGLALLDATTVGTYNVVATIATSRFWMTDGRVFKSFSGARPPYGTIGWSGVLGAEVDPVLAGGNTQSLVGVMRTYSWPASLSGVERLVASVGGLTSSDAAQTTIGLSFNVSVGGLPTSLVVDFTSSTNPDGSPNWTAQTQVVPPASPLSADATVSESLTGLTPDTEYWWRVEATNAEGTIISDFATFATLAISTGAPVVVTQAASSITSSGATLVGTVDPSNLATQYYFEYGTSSTLASFTSTTDTALGVIDDTAHTVSAVISGLAASTTYYCRLHAYNSAAPEASGGVDGSIVSFATAAASVGAPIPATGTPTTARAVQLVVPGSVDPNGGSTTWKAQASTNGFSSVAAETSAAALPDSTAGNVQSVSGTITGLTPGTAYTTRITATNSASTVNASASGSISTEPVPNATGLASSSITAASAHLAGDVHHAGISTDIIVNFEWGTSTSYGSTSSTQFVLKADADPKTIGLDISSLTASTTYHWRLNMTRSGDGDGGTIHSPDQTFTTAATPSLLVVTTPTAYGPASAISTGATVGVPAYTIQVAADGTLHRSDTHAGVTISGTLFNGSGTLIIESDTAGTQRTPAAGVFDQIIAQGPKLILRELIGATNQGAFESNNSAAGVDFAIEFQGCSGDWTHGRAVACSAGAIRLTKSPSGLLCGSQGSSWPSWVGGTGKLPSGQSGPSGYMRLDNWTGQNITASTVTALQVDAARNVQIGGFDAGSQSTYAGPVAAPLAQHAVRLDAALRTGGVKTDVQDVYITDAADTTPSMLSSKAGTYTLRAGTMKRSGIQAATFLNTLHQRPEKPIWFELANGTAPGSETSVNCTNAGVIAEHFVLRNALSQNLVTNTLRDGATKDQQYEVRCDVYDPADALTLWTPAQVMDVWPNGNRFFIRVDGVRRSLGARSSTPATNKDLSIIINKAVIDETWTHMGGVTGDGTTEIIGALFDPDPSSMAAGGTPLVSVETKFGATIAVKTATAISTTTPVTLPVQAPGGGAPVWTGWDDGTKGKKAITGATSATPISIKAVKHGYTSGDVARIAAVGGNTAANGDWTVTVVDKDNFTLNGSVWTSGAYTSGGTSLRRADIFGVLTSYTESISGMTIRRQLGYFGIDKVGNNLLEVVLIPGPTSTPEKRIGETPAGITPAEILKITAGVAETFHPHGYPTGEFVDIATPALTGNFQVTRVDSFHFSINGQSGITWNPGPGTVGTATPTTLHSYGLTGQSTSFTIPVGTTLDSTQNANAAQGTNNVSVHLKAGSRVRFIGCTFNDISFVCDSAASIPELVDCDGAVIALPGGYDYDSISTLGVAGKYDRYTQPIPARMLVGNNWMAGQDCVWYHTRTVLTGAHGDVFPARFLAGNEFNEVYVDQSSPVGTNNDSEAQARSGVGQNLPAVIHSTHGDINQWFGRGTVRYYKSILAGQAHSVYFGTITAYEKHTGATLSNNGSGKYLVTLAGVEKHNFDSTGLDTVLISNAGALNGAYTVSSIGSGSKSFLLNESTYPVAGSPTTADTEHTIILTIPGCFRSTLTTVKHVDNSDRTRLSPILAKGNLTIGIGLKASPQNDGGTPSKLIVVPGIAEYRVTIRDCCIDNGGDFNLPDPLTNSSWIDLGSPNRNVFTAYSGTGIPGATAVVHYTD